ncbi:hypothetical protein Bca4012_010723 [Brassica carinata]
MRIQSTVIVIRGCSWRESCRLAGLRSTRVFPNVVVGVPLSIFHQTYVLSSFRSRMFKAIFTFLRFNIVHSNNVFICLKNYQFLFSFYF